jgi:alpha-glucosidase (family GH31 glycosyl hydrolase)
MDGFSGTTQAMQKGYYEVWHVGGRDHLEDQGVDGIRMDLREFGWGSVD